MKKMYTEPHTEQIVLEAGNQLMSGSKEGAFAPPINMPQPGTKAPQKTAPVGLPAL